MGHPFGFIADGNALLPPLTQNSAGKQSLPTFSQNVRLMHRYIVVTLPFAKANSTVLGEGPSPSVLHLAPIICGAGSLDE